MATTVASHAAQAVQLSTEKRRSALSTFVGDLIEDLGEMPMTPAKDAKHDIFREHINAMSISYFALIILLLIASVPVMAYSISFLVAY